MSSGSPLKNPRFAPMFWTQFLGAFNDNLFKNALVILVTFGGASTLGMDPAALVAAASAIFILPFFLFSATGGQLADKLEKSQLVRWVKLAEIVIMLLGAFAFLSGSTGILLLLLFLMGTQSAFFGPVKYGILPQLLDEDDLVGGNALIETATYLAILGGTIAGGVLVTSTIGGVPGTSIVAVMVVLVAGLGFLTSRRIPECPPESPELVVQWDPIRPTVSIIAATRQVRPVWLSVLGITWFWGFGTVLLSVFPPYTRDVLNTNGHVATLFLAAFSIGIGGGSMLCERLSRHRLELGIVPIGSFFMSVFALDLWWVGAPFDVAADAPLNGISWLIAQPAGLRILVDLVGLAMAGGLYIVPLYTMIQQRSAPEERSRIIAGNNIINAAFMVAASLALMAMQAVGLSVPQVFGVLALVNVAVAVYVYTIVPEFLLRFVAWMLSNVLYRVEVRGLDNIPKEGGAVVVANHITFVDWLVLGGAIKRPLQFVMDKSFAHTPVVGTLARQGGVIPIASAKRDPACLAQAMETIHDKLEEGWIVGLFPEGHLTDDGEIDTFRPGVERIVGRDPVPVIPVAINGMWGSWFSRSDGVAVKKRPRRFWSRVAVTIGEPMDPSEATAEALQAKVTEMWKADGRP